MKNKLHRILEPGPAIYMASMVLIIIVAAILKQYYLAAGVAVLLVALAVYQQSIQTRRRHEIAQYVKSATGSLVGATQDPIALPFPMALIKLSTNEIMWNNEAFQAITGQEESLFEHKIHDLFPGFATSWLAEGHFEQPGDVQSGGKRYHVLGTLIRSDTGDEPVLLGMTFWLDNTDLLNVRDEYNRSRPVIASILIDNYDELTANLSDSAVSTINAELGEKVSQWCDHFSGLLRKLERNRFLFIFEARTMNLMLDDKFSLLDSIREVASPSGISATASIGVGRDAGSFTELFDYSNLAIEMSLSRGGDQAVVKDNYNFTFYGGRTQEAERHTKVKSRVMANSLRELIRQSSSVFVVGHRNSDIDAIGAAAGIVCLCRKLGKRVSIVADLQNTLAENLIAALRELPEYESVFVSEQDALIQADRQSLLVVVDTNRPDQVDAKGLLGSIERIVVIDHHRRAADYIENVDLNLHEPYASSAAELTTELLQYSVDPADIRPIEASALLSGIALDTKNFTVRTGSRTFEAAAFLRRCGADTIVVKKMFQNDLASTLERYRLMQSARLYRKQIAICALEDATDRAVASQAADELLTITGINTSFVLYPMDGKVYISARSIGDANVQMILEPLGGGGNAATAGAQVPNKTVREVLGELVASIDNFYES